MSDTPRTNEAWAFDPYEGKALSLCLVDVRYKTSEKLERELSAAKDKIESLQRDLDLHAFQLSPAMVQARNDQLCAVIEPAKRALAVVSQFRKCIEDPNSYFMDLCGKPEPIAQLTEIYDALKKALGPFEEQTPGCGHIGVTQ